MFTFRADFSVNGSHKSGFVIALGTKGTQSARLTYDRGGAPGFIWNILPGRFGILFQYWTLDLTKEE